MIFNCKSFEDTELMFYQNCNAYHWYPDEKELNKLLNDGYKIAAFKSHTNQPLPNYMTEHPQVKIINTEMQ